MRYIEGIDRHQLTVFPVTVDEMISEDNPIRFIDAYIANLDVTALDIARSRPKDTGRPGYDPRDMLRLYLYGCLHGLVSSRRLARACRINIEMIWLVRGLHPCFKTIAEFRKDNSAGLEQVCKEFISFCRSLKAVDDCLVAIDGSKLKASASRQSARSLQSLQSHLQQLERQQTTYLRDLDRYDREEDYLQDELAYQEARPEACSSEEPPSAGPGSAALSSRLDQVRRFQEDREEQLERNQRQQAKVESAYRHLQQSGQSQECRSDADARLMKSRQSYGVCYNGQIAVSEGHKLIVAYELSNAVSDIEKLEPMAVAAKEALGVEELEVIADAGYSNITQIDRCRSASITAYVPAIKTAQNTGGALYHKDDFIYEAHSDSYYCPGGYRLHCSGAYYDRQKGVTLREYISRSCRDCQVREQCTHNKRGRRIRRRPDEEVYEWQRSLAAAHPEKLARRKALVEHVFGTMKHYYNRGCLLTRGLSSVRAEFSLMVLSYNMRRMLNIFGSTALIKALKDKGTRVNQAVNSVSNHALKAIKHWNELRLRNGPVAVEKAAWCFSVPA